MVHKLTVSVKRRRERANDAEVGANSNDTRDAESCAEDVSAEKLDVPSRE